MTIEPDRPIDSGRPIGQPNADNELTTESRMRLGTLVAIGTVVVTLAGGALFVWLAWLLSHQPAPLRGDTGWWTWLSHADGGELFDAARTTATILAIVGIGGAALVAYRRQDTAERAHKVTIHAQQIATRQLTLDSNKYQLDRNRHDLEVDRRKDDREKDARERLSAAAEHLGSADYGVRRAGAYALASLADDWHRFGNDIQRQVCVELLCAQLRRPRLLTAFMQAEDPQQDLEVRKAIVALIRSHRPISSDDPDSWNSCAIDLSGADLSTFDLNEVNFSSVNLDNANLTSTTFVRANLSGAMMARTTLSAASFLEADLTGARLYSARVNIESPSDAWANRVSFEQATLRGAWLTSAELPHVDFQRADLTEAKLLQAKLFEADFDNAILTKARLNSAKLGSATFIEADLRGANFASATLHDNNFEGAKHDADTLWPGGHIPSQLT